MYVGRYFFSWFVRVCLVSYVFHSVFIQCVRSLFGLCRSLVMYVVYFVIYLFASFVRQFVISLCWLRYFGSSFIM